MAEISSDSNGNLKETINTLGEVMMLHNRKNSPKIKDFLDAMLLSLTKIYDLERVGAYVINASGEFAEPISVIGQDNKEEHQELLKKLPDCSLDEIICGERASPSLEKKFKDYKIPLDKPSRFQNSYKTGYSFIGKDPEGYEPTEVDKKIFEIFGTTDYILMTLKGKKKEGDIFVEGKGEKVIGFIYCDFKFSGEDLSKIEKEGVTRLIVENISSYLQMVREQEDNQESQYWARLGRLTANINDSVRNPLTTIGGGAKRILDKLKAYNKTLSSSDEAKLRESIKKGLPFIVTQVEELTKYFKWFSDYARQRPKPQYSAVKVYPLIEDALKSVESEKENLQITGDKNLMTWTDPKMYSKALGIIMAEFDSKSSNNLFDPSFKLIKSNGYARVDTLLPPPFTELETRESLYAAKMWVSLVGGDLSLRETKGGTKMTLVTPIYIS